MLQAGVKGVVSALHHVTTGAVWSREEITKRQDEIARMKDGTPSGLRWDVVESLPVSEDIKKQSGDWRIHVANYKTSFENLATGELKLSATILCRCLIGRAPTLHGACPTALLV